MVFLRPGFLAQALLLEQTSMVHADAFEDVVVAFERGDYAPALRILRQRAEQGFADAQASLGHMYENGQGVPQDDAEAVEWFRKAAEQGVAGAQYDKLAACDSLKSLRHGAGDGGLRAHSSWLAACDRRL